MTQCVLSKNKDVCVSVCPSLSVFHIFPQNSGLADLTCCKSVRKSWPIAGMDEVTWSVECPIEKAKIA